MSGIEASAGGTPAPYGRACTNCARAKCRCIYRVAGPKCERCERLGKQCIPSVTVRKRNGRRQLGSRTAQLEEKLDDIVTLLRKQNTDAKLPSPNKTTITTVNFRPSPPDLWAHTPASSHGNQPDAAPPQGTQDQSDQTVSSPGPGPPSGPHILPAVLGQVFNPNLFNCPPSVPTSISISSLIEFPDMPATPQEADEHLAIFRERYLEWFPCIYIPAEMTSPQLRSEKPFTWFTIMMVSCQISSLQFRMGSVWEKIISQKMVVEHDKDIDYLQGIIIFLAWSQYHKKDKPYLALFIQLALSLIYDLKLNKLHGNRTPLACFKSSLPPEPRHGRERTVEERRTVLACFYITSQIAYALEKMDGLRWTAHMNDCLTFLSDHPEWPGDEVLAAQVRTQLIIDQLGSDGPTAPSPSFTPYYLVSALSSPVEAVRKQLPPGLDNNEAVHIQLIYAELVVLENGLGWTPYDAKKPGLRRYEILSKSADTIKRWFEKFFLLSEVSYTGVSITVWFQLAHCLMSLYKLTALDEPAWDRAALRRDIDLLQISDRLIRAVEEAGISRRSRQSKMVPKTTTQPPADDDMFAACTRMITSLRNAWIAELGALKPNADGSANGEVLAEHGFVDNVTTGPLAMPMDFMDDVWLTDIFNVSWE